MERMNQVTENQMMFAKNMESHIKAIQKLGNEVEGLSKILKKLKE